MAYPGGKNGAGVYQAIINQMPPHRRYIEPFVGGGAILLHKRPAERSIIADLDGEALTATTDEARRRGIDVLPYETCGLALLEGLIAELQPRPEITARRRGRPPVTFGRAIDRFKIPVLGPKDLVYCDPPYLLSTRTKKRIYAYEMTDKDHSRLLDIARRLPCMVMLSGYDNLLYRMALPDWRRVEYMAPTRGGPRPECLWCNFDPPAALHDYRYVGDGFRERERIRKKVARWQSNFAGLPILERRAILSALLRIETRDLASPETSRGSTAEPAGDDSGTAGEGEGSSGPLSLSASTNGTAGDDELSERGRHKGGFPQSGPIDGSGGEPWPPRVLP